MLGITSMTPLESINNDIKLDNIKAFLRIDHNYDDSLLLELYKAAIEECENYSCKALVKRKWLIVYRSKSVVQISELRLPIMPAIQIYEMKYSLLNGNDNILDPKYIKITDDKASILSTISADRVILIYTAGPIFNKLSATKDSIEDEYQRVVDYDCDRMPFLYHKRIMERVAEMYEARAWISNHDIKYSDFRYYRL